ncbi:MAG: glycosyltransferase [Clostridiales bacterium]|nr:glycosyltransferase [Clostridiales bacterium]
MTEKQPLISIIIPVYKVEQYIRQCVNSAISQTFTNLEIILIDDGSPDCCGTICDEYAEMDCRIKVIHKENGGLSDARNAGVEISRGEYLAFMDGDDWMDIDTIELLYKNLIDHNADISSCSYFIVYTNTIIKKDSNRKISKFSPEQAIKNYLLHNIPDSSACCKLYKKHIFSDVRFPINKRCEDIFIIADVFSRATTIINNATPKYYYRQRRSSITKCDKYNPNILDLIEAYKHVLCVVEKEFPSLVDICKEKLLMAKISVLQSMLLSKEYGQIPEYKKMLLAFRSNYSLLMKADNYNSKEKIALSVLKVNVRLYKLLIAFLDIKNRRTKPRIMFD